MYWNFVPVNEILFFISLINTEKYLSWYNLLHNRATINMLNINWTILMNLFLNLLISEIKDMFKLFDKNGDNNISTAEMGKVLRTMGFQMTNKEIRAAVKQIDTNGKQS